MFEVTGKGEYWYDYINTDIGLVSTLEEAHALIQQYSHDQYVDACVKHFKMNVIHYYVITELFPGVTYLDNKPMRTRITEIRDPHSQWFLSDNYTVDEVQYMTEKDQDLLYPPSVGEWIQYNYDVNLARKISATSSYVLNSIQKKIRDIKSR